MSEEERAQQSRDRNRKHARNTWYKITKESVRGRTETDIERNGSSTGYNRYGATAVPTAAGNR